MKRNFRWEGDPALSWGVHAGEFVVQQIEHDDPRRSRTIPTGMSARGLQLRSSCLSDVCPRTIYAAIKKRWPTFVGLVDQGWFKELATSPVIARHWASFCLIVSHWCLIDCSYIDCSYHSPGEERNPRLW